MTICYKEDLIYAYKKATKEERLELYEEFVFMREIFNDLDLCELNSKSNHCSSISNMRGLY
ncbi:MAG: hypothetical protein JXR90_03505 [Spirochaetes bacterium]|nr:hypothetical protein [Spirochaetota bacterium]